MGDTNTFFTDGNYGEAYPKASDMTDSSNGIPFLTGGNLKGGKLDITGASYITPEKHAKLTSGHLIEDDIVIAVRGSLGALGYVKSSNSGWNINSQLAILRTDKSVLSGKYLIQFLLSGIGQKELLIRQTGSALKQLPIGSVKDVPIPITSVEEQGKIGEFFEQLDNLITLHQLKGAILDAVDEGLIPRDPTRKVIIKGKTPSNKKVKYLNQFELHTLLKSLKLKDRINWDWFILLIAKTGMRFSEALAITPADFDFAHQALSVNKTWNYKSGGGFAPTKNRSSVRKIQIDWQLVMQFASLVKDLPSGEPIFITKEAVYNSTVNDILERYCKRLDIPVISVHGLRHTHASLLLYAGVSIASVARRLGHASMTTTQKTYLHVIQELENQDIDLVMRSLSNLM